MLVKKLPLHWENYMAQNICWVVARIHYVILFIKLILFFTVHTYVDKREN